MSNMSNCRFENTNRDLADCEEALNDGAEPDNLSQDEARACISLIKRCVRIAENYGELVIRHG